MARNHALSSGEVRQLDLTTRRLTIKHGELRNVGMPGDRIRFRFRDLSSVAHDMQRVVNEKLKMPSG